MSMEMKGSISSPGDLERLKAVLKVLDDGRLIRRLYRIRGKGRNDWPYGLNFRENSLQRK